jgi:hypothetical protein
VYVDSLGITSSEFWRKFQVKTVVLTCRCTWENNIKMGRKEIGWNGVDWNLMAEDGGGLLQT